jgi:hypothetical protein
MSTPNLDFILRIIKDRALGEKKPSSIQVNPELYGLLFMELKAPKSDPLVIDGVTIELNESLEAGKFRVKV